MSEVCLGLRLCVPFWCGFRDPISSNVHRTFPVPPPSTLYGLIAAALGLSQDDYSRRNEMRFAIAIEKAGEQVETFSKWMKIAEPAKDSTQKDARNAMRIRGLLTPDEATWVSTTLTRQKLIQPIWKVGVLCSGEVADEISSALNNPHWPLYLGESDDSVDVEVLGIETPQPSREAATGTIGGVHAGGTLANLPTRFSQAARGKWELTRWLVTVPKVGEAIAANTADIVACHGQVWQFEPRA
jgi:CRISPR-associated Cas5-like protein